MKMLKPVGKTSLDAMPWRIAFYLINPIEIIISYVPCYKIRDHDPSAPGAGALATGRRTLPSVGTRIFTAAPSWPPLGGSTVSLCAITVNSMENRQK